MTDMANSNLEEVFGKEVGLVHKAIVTGRKVGANRKFWIKLADDVEFFGRIVEAANERPRFNLAVNYHRSLGRMIEVSHINEFNPNITQENFPKTGSGVAHKIGELFQFEDGIKKDEIIAEINEEGFRPAKIEELLALAESHLDLCQNFPIIALGSIWCSDNDFQPYVPELWSRNRDIRCLRLVHTSVPYSSVCRFLGISIVY